MDIKEVEVMVTKFQTTNGRKFTTMSDAEFHQAWLDGRTCQSCKGLGKVDPYGDGREHIVCSECGGKGWK